MFAWCRWQAASGKSQAASLLPPATLVIHQSARCFIWRTPPTIHPQSITGLLVPDPLPWQDAQSCEDRFRHCHEMRRRHQANRDVQAHDGIRSGVDAPPDAKQRRQNALRLCRAPLAHAAANEMFMRRLGRLSPWSRRSARTRNANA